MNVNLLGMLLVAHLIGDFVLQTDKIAYMKGTSKKGLVIHGFIVMVTNIVFLSLYGIKGVALAIGIGLVHHQVDSLKERVSVYFKKKTFLLFTLDQMVHIIIITVCTFIFSREKSYYSIKLDYIKLAIEMILLSYVSTIIVILVIKDFYPNLKKNEFFKKNERIIDALTCVAIGLMLHVVFPINIVLVGLLLPLYYKFQKQIFDYNINIVSIKYVIFIIMGYGVKLFL